MCSFHCGGEVKPKNKKQKSVKICENCAYFARDFQEEPCVKCRNHNYWKKQCKW